MAQLSGTDRWVSCTATINFGLSFVKRRVKRGKDTLGISAQQILLLHGVYAPMVSLNLTEPFELTTERY